MPGKERARWRKRRSSIGKVVGDPDHWDYLDGSSVLATVKRTAHGFAVSMPSGETAGPFGDVGLAKQSATRRVQRERAGLSPWSPPAPGG